MLSVRPLTLKTTTFSNQDSAKTLSICYAELLQPHKDRNSFRITGNTQGIELQNSLNSLKLKANGGEKSWILTITYNFRLAKQPSLYIHLADEVFYPWLSSVQDKALSISDLLFPNVTTPDIWE